MAELEQIDIEELKRKAERLDAVIDCVERVIESNKKIVRRSPASFHKEAYMRIDMADIVHRIAKGVSDE